MTQAALEPMMIWLLVGLLSGLIASFVFIGDNVLRYLAAGVAGAMIVGYFIAVLGVYVPISDWVWRNVAIATLGALPVIFIARVFD